MATEKTQEEEITTTIHNMMCQKLNLAVVVNGHQHHIELKARASATFNGRGSDLGPDVQAKLSAKYIRLS